MGKETLRTWSCDNPGCDRSRQGLEMPPGWLRTEFVNQGKTYRYCFCTYSCLGQWAIMRKEYYDKGASPVMAGGQLE